jgi:hypothetical protein
MDVIIEFGKILLPAALVLYAMYLTMKSVLAREVLRAEAAYKSENGELIIQRRLQAYERMSLFLERLSPGNLVLRINAGSMSARELQHLMIQEIREEFNHNLSQQIYMSDEAWKMIKDTVEDVKALINTSAEKLDEKAKSVELAKLIFNAIEEREVDTVELTLAKVKSEIRELF